MNAQASTDPVSTQYPTREVTRPLANFHADVWGDRFLSYPTESTDADINVENQVQGLKEQVRKMMAAATGNPSRILNLIDLIQRLGLFYHFESEIDQALRQALDANVSDEDKDDLYMVALRFRLLRQHGFHVSSDVFNNFMDENGSFKEHLISDVRAVLSLYEASYLRVHGEDILEEALAFTTTCLESKISHLSPPLSSQVRMALTRPIRRSLPRLQARHFISIYEEDASHDKVLLAFAKLDFNRLQKLHQSELGDISRWWRELDVVTKLPYVRQRLVEGLFWTNGVYFEPQYSFARKIFAKVFFMSLILDDTYDAYAILEEMEILTEAIERWDRGYLDKLPEYLKLFYEELIDVYEEFERELATHGRSDCVHYAKEAIKKLAQAYLVEAKWSRENYIPPVDDYMSNALVSVGYSMLIITSFLGMCDIATKNIFEYWSSSDLKIVRAASVVARLMDDIGSHEFEQQRVHVASAMECYMKQHGVSEQEAINEFNKQIEDAWKDINEAFVTPNAYMPMPLLNRVLNLTRMIDLLYKDGSDELTHVGEVMKSSVTSLFIDPVSI